MTDEHALLAAMAADPTDDTVRLAYADFLEEQGDSDRAEFVRLQVELNRRNENDMTRHALVVRHVKFLRDQVPRWRAELPRLPGIEWGDFRRGLVEEVHAVNEKAIVKHASVIFSQPAIHVLRLSRLTAASSLAKLPELARLRALRIIGAAAEDRTLCELLGSPKLERLIVLDLDGNRLADSGAKLLAEKEWPALAELWLGSNRIGNEGARTLALAGSSQFTALKLLDLRKNWITEFEIQNLLMIRYKRALKL